MPIVVAAMAFRQSKSSYDVYYNMLTRWFAFPHIGRKAKTLGLIWPFKNKQFAIHVARLTIHEVDIRNFSFSSDNLDEDGRWRKR